MLPVANREFVARSARRVDISGQRFVAPSHPLQHKQLTMAGAAADHVPLSELPTASGGIARAALTRAAQQGLNTEMLLKRVGLRAWQTHDHSIRIPVQKQIVLLNAAAEELRDPFIGIRLAQRLELRDLGLLYYVPASSATFEEALRRLARYSTILNEGVRLSCNVARELSIKIDYVGVSRLSDRHQIEFFVATLVRLCRQLAGRNLTPTRISMLHDRISLPRDLATLFGCSVAFGASVDEVCFSLNTRSIAIVSSDKYLNSLLVKYCDDALTRSRHVTSPWRLRVENAIAPLLPHGRPPMAQIATQLGLSQRSLGRRLASEQTTFEQVLDDMRVQLSKRYLRERTLPISGIAWLLGYSDVSSFDHAFKRWTGKSPKETRFQKSKERSIGDA
jgi:AraC-like DNA-binding protein